MDTLFRREVMRFWAEKSRWLGLVAQPLMFWLLIGTGFSPSVKLDGISFTQYFFPGTWIMCLLFTCIFGSMSIIEDRREGFLQGVLSSPCKKVEILLGKSLGVIAIGLIQSVLFLMIAPMAGFPLKSVHFPNLIVSLFFGLAMLTFINIYFAWWLNSTSSYHAVMSLIMIPLWVISGALFPLKNELFSYLSWINPIGVFHGSLYSSLQVNIITRESAEHFVKLLVSLASWTFLSLAVTARKMENTEEKL